MIAALFVAPPPRGVYHGLPGVEPWDEKRDARNYAGPWPVVAHPPCGRWINLAFLNYSRYGGEHNRPGNDGGCFAAALAAVRRWGGVLEHPAFSRAWAAHGLTAPSAVGGWARADELGGWACHVEQGNYGHRARKATWLYLNGVDRPAVRWGPSVGKAWCTPGASSKASRGKVMKPMNKRERQATPIAFRDLLISIAESANVEAQEAARG